MDALERFMAKVDQSGDCWLWQAKLSHNGYGCFWFENREIRAHAWLYERAVGKVPDGYVLDHLCHIRNCVRVNHLEPVTPYENLMRTQNIVAINKFKTHCIHGHEFNDVNTKVIYRRGRPERRCRLCVNERARGYRLGRA